MPKVRDGGAEGHVSWVETCLTARQNGAWRERNDYLVFTE